MLTSVITSHMIRVNLGNPIYFPHLSITECRSSTPFFLPSGIYSTAGLSAYMAILSLTSVMGPVLRSTSQRSPQRITAATTDSTFFHGKVENSFVRSPAGPAQLSRPTAVQRRQINKAAVHVQSSQWHMPHHRIPRHLFALGTHG